MRVEDHRLQRATSDRRARDRRRVEDHRLQRATSGGWARDGRRVGIVSRGGLKNWLFLFSQKI